MPAVTSVSPQMLGRLLNVIEKLLPPPASHWCLLSSPPPSPVRTKRRRRRRRRSKSPTSSTYSSHFSNEELPATFVIKKELEWDDFANEDLKSEDQEEQVEREIFTMPPPSQSCVVEKFIVKEEGSIVLGQKDISADVAAKATNEAKFGSSPPVKVPGEAENIGRLINCVNETNTKRSAGKSPYEPRMIDREDFPGLGDRDVIFSAPVSPPRVDFKALGFGPRFLPRPELFPVQSCSQGQAVYLCEDGHNCRASGHHYTSSTRWFDGH